MKHLQRLVLTLCAPRALAASRHIRTFAIGNKRRQGEGPVTIMSRPTTKIVRKLQSAQVLLAAL